MATENVFHRFNHGHQDLVLAIDYNLYGTRMVTASSDHRLQVWDRKDDGWSVTDAWTAHAAEVSDVKWNGPYVGEILASIGEDGLLRIWQEDVLEAPRSGKRFKRIYQQPSASKVPYMSLDFKNIGNETYLALISRDGQLTVCEPVDHDNLAEWQIMWQDYLCKTPTRTEETGFRVCWHHEKLPAWPAVLAGLDRKSLSLAVSVMDTVKVFRTDRDRKFYTAAELTGAKGLIRDVAWANGSMRGYDVIATASKDGFIRIYELHTPGAKDLPTTNLDTPDMPATKASSTGQRTARSGIGAGLTSGSRGGRNDEEYAPGKVVHDVRLVAELQAHNGAAWRVAFSQMGELLISTGDDGLVQVWKRGLNGQWLQYAEIDGNKES
ncbi:hypothetical protein M8818_002883 [Zalaria obscura]|uniref:Uncharacterized protein n=1 Tax=Zalaria obscura TaxID=2024903 RepID=A0ACC3SJ75_9PEZI